MKAIEVKHFIKDGIKVVSVDLGNVDKSVILHEQDLRELLNLGASLPWKWRQDMVWCRNNYKDVNIARLLLNLDAGKVVRYRNGNGLDLTRGNLLVVNCMSKYRTRALMKRGNPKQRCEIKHIYEEEKVSA